MKSPLVPSGTRLHAAGFVNHQKNPGRLTRSLAAFMAMVGLLAAMALPAHAGVALKLFYDPIPGVQVINLTTNSIFPNSPTLTEVLVNGLQESQNFADNFGAWTRGFIEAPQTGQYTFWIASDDDGEFWLSTSGNPAGLVKIAENVGAVGTYAYTIKPAQQSALISLVKGQKYYFEMFHKEGPGNDHCEIAWTLPDGTHQNVLPSVAQWPYPVNLADPAYSALAKAPDILTSYLGVPVSALDPSGTTSVVEGLPLDLTVTAEASQPATVQWSSNGVPIPNANLLNYHIPRVTLSQNAAVYSIVISNSLGQTNASTTLSVTADTTAPTLADAINLGNFTGDIAVVFSESVDPVTAANAGNYSINNGVTVTGARMGSTPETVLLQTSGLTVGPVYTVTVNNVRDLASTPNTISPGSSIQIGQGLSGWYRLDETTGTNIVDTSGNNRNGVLLTNGVALGYAGKVLNAANFDGVSGYVALQTNNFNYDDFTQGFTVALWAYPTASAVNWARFIDFGNGPGNDNIIFSRNGTTPDLTFEVRLNITSAGQVTAPGAIALNQWQHFVATMDNTGTVVLYKNGVPLTTNVLTSVPNVVTRTNNYLGRSNFPQDGYYAGEMDDVRIYTRALSPAAVAALANGGGADDANPSAQVVTVVATVPTTDEKSTPPGVFTVTRTGPTNSSLTVNYALGGTATNGVAYTNLPGTIVIPAGATNARVFVTPIDLAFQQIQQTVILSLSNSTNYLIGNPGSDTVTIINNDNTTPPAATYAFADNAHGTQPNKLEVWFSSPVTLPSAVNVTNYTLVNAPGVTVTNATAANLARRVVLGLSGPVPTNALLNVSGVQGPGGYNTANQIAVRALLAPFNIVSDTYHGGAPNRVAAFNVATDGVVNNSNNGGTGFDTFNGGNQPTEFVGLQYATSQDFQNIKVDLGQQFGDGGTWRTVPKVYILTTPIDTASIRPEVASNYWVQVPATLASASTFPGAGVDPNPSPNTPILFDLSALPANQRTGYGWAVGGVKGAGAVDFISITEVRAYGFQGTNSSFSVFLQQPQNRTVVQGQRTTFVENPASIAATTYQWLLNGTPIGGATDVNYTIPPAALSDNGAQFNVVLTSGSLVNTSQVATLTVLARTNPPVVLAATLDLANSLIDVWFDEPVDPTTAQTLGNYTLNDPALSITGITQDANQLRANLSFSGTPSVSNLTVTVSGVQDPFGFTLTSQTTPILPLNWPVQNVVANAYQQPRAVCLTDSTNGIVIHATGDGNIWETFEGTLNPFTSDFVGLIYNQPQAFGIIKLDLGFQFGDGGDWQTQPSVYILTNKVDTSTSPPESNTNWMAVPATLISGNAFNYAIDGPAGVPVNTPITFDLTHLAPNQRAGYGWAIGGVPGNGGAHFLSSTELRAFGVPAGSFTNSTGAPQILLDVRPTSLTYPSGFPLNYTVYVTGTQPISYQWKFNGTNLADNGRISGSHSSSLTIAEVFASDAGTYQLFMTNSVGNNASTLLTLAVTRPALNNGAGWTQNGGAVITNNVLTLTDGLVNEARSSFLNYPEYIGAFTATFTYQDVGGGGADGAVFVLQNDPRGASALGGGGGGLGYSGITPSAALEFNIYGPNIPGIALRSNGATGTPYSPTTPVNLASGDPIGVTVNYDGTTISLTLTDAVTHVSFSTNYLADIPAIVGTNSAYVGITGADGGLASTQKISNFLFLSLPKLSVQATGGTFVFTWPGSAGGFLLQQNSDLSTSNWVNVASPITLVNGQNQVVVSPAGGNRFYRLSLP
jgi:hypothetical protein